VSSTVAIFLRTGLPPNEVASRLASILDAEVTTKEDRVLVSRRGAEADLVGGEVERNRYGAPPDPEPDELSVLEGYDTAFGIRSLPRGDEVLLREARAIYDAVIHRLPWPVLLVSNMSILVAAWNPAIGLTEFAPGTTPDLRHRELWAPYDLPAVDPTHRGG
jgi:hypothetical protein